ncbi:MULTISPECIES: hypothetical protein [unclassified Thalassolituus]|uniref:hypothetical protein n=1 Tax=unclassified Thalassolituus TaxID=2624967 RepID=UPI0025E53A4F|nr:MULTISPECIES: hypothetical protein [unclassified Thalassolituus]|tara:strand:+ start:514 stop:2862 length:2349 start_codon:yes stop_codon:yes gene_type:complete
MRFRLYLAVFFLFFSVACNAYGRAWQYRTIVQISNGAGRDLSNQPVVLNLNAQSLSADYNWSAAGDDLRITLDDENESSAISFEIRDWNATARTATIVLLVPNFPPIGSGSNHNLYLFYDNNGASSVSQDVTPARAAGLLYQTRYNSPANNPGSREEAEGSFNAAPASQQGYGEATLQEFTGVRNSDVIPGGTNGDYIMRVSAYFSVANTGQYQFRAGVDFGFGASLYLNDGSQISVDRWNQTNPDLWWNNNWNNDAGVLTTDTGWRFRSGNNYLITLIGAENYSGSASSLQYRRRFNGSNNWSNWRAFSTDNPDGIVITSDAPVSYPELSVSSFNSTLNLTQGVDLTIISTPMPDYWFTNKGQEVTFTVRNNGTDAVSAGVTVRLDNSSNLDITSVFLGAGWTCGSGQCQYTGATVVGGDDFPPIRLSFTGMATGTGTYNGSVEHPDDVDPSNNGITGSAQVVDLIRAVTPECAVPGPGLLATFYDVEADWERGNFVRSHADFDSIISLVVTPDATPLSSQILGTVNGSGVPGSNQGDYYLGIFTGYIRIPSDGYWSLGVIGDDSVEVLINDVVYSHFYQGVDNWNNGAIVGRTTLFLEAGYHRLEYRVHENDGDDTYQFYMREGQSTNNLTIVSPDILFQCYAAYDLRLTSSLQVESDPVNNTNSPKAIPGAMVRVTGVASNRGTLRPGQDSIAVTQTIPADADLFLNGGAPVSFDASDSGLNLNSISYSSDGTNFNVPAGNGDYNENIRYFRLNLNGTMAPANGSNYPQFTYEYRIRLK